MVAGSSSEMVAGDDKDGAPRKLIKGNNKFPSSVTSVLSNYDLLVEILLRLPVLSLVLFKSVSKHWLKIITSPNFILRRQSEHPNLDPPFGLFIPRNRLQYDFESFDIRIPSKRSILFTLGSEAPLGRVEILQSCNGLLLCSNPYEYYVYNPTINQFKMVPLISSAYIKPNQPIHSLLPASSLISSARMAFDPTKSPHYKLIQPVQLPNADDLYGVGSKIQVHTYSSETGVWSACGSKFRDSSFEAFKEGVYWNDAIHWLGTNWGFMTMTMHFKLDIENEQPVLTEIELPVTFDGKSYSQSKMFESRGCLLLLGKDYAHSQQLNVYEMRNGYSEWSVKYIVDLDAIMMPLPRTWLTRSRVWSIILGESEEDCFMIIDLLSKVVQYNLVLKTVHTLADLESNQSIGSPLMVPSFDGFQFIASFAEV